MAGFSTIRISFGQISISESILNFFSPQLTKINMKVKACFRGGEIGIPFFQKIIKDSRRWASSRKGEYYSKLLTLGRKQQNWAPMQWEYLSPSVSVFKHTSIWETNTNIPKENVHKILPLFILKLWDKDISQKTLYPHLGCPYMAIAPF